YDKTVIEEYLTGKNKISPITRLALTSEIAHTGKFAVNDLISVIKELKHDLQQKNIIIQSLQTKIELVQKMLTKNTEDIKRNNPLLESSAKPILKINDYPLVKTLLDPREIKPNKKELKENERNKLYDILKNAILTKGFSEVHSVFKNHIDMNKKFDIIKLTHQTLYEVPLFIVLIVENTFDQHTQKIADLFLEAGADINLGDFNQETPLHWAVYLNSEGWVEYLLNKSANVAATNVGLKTPLKDSQNVLHLSPKIKVLLDKAEKKNLDRVRHSI
ncbi:MAG TPA: ankyrin repeat domain-containing protein, partial [Gammaproteobacteria bacterium]|nr:ankyrin repeat domain-containing protein [Gammaproteobacteria bacterium]